MTGFSFFREPIKLQISISYISYPLYTQQHYTAGVVALDVQCLQYILGELLQVHGSFRCRYPVRSFSRKIPTSRLQGRFVYQNIETVCMNILERVKSSILTFPPGRSVPAVKITRLDNVELSHELSEFFQQGL
jgi:hypothetical protein